MEKQNWRGPKSVNQYVYSDRKGILGQALLKAIE
jgi:hypothetical protein